MTVSKLIKLLSKQNPKALVVLSSDSEGNSFGLCEAVSPPYKYLDGDGIDPEEVEVKGGKECIVLWP
jgi:hypothetical protein